MRNLLLLSLLSIFAFTSCDIDVDVHYDNLPYSVWAGSVTNSYTKETVEYTIAFDGERSFSIVKVLYDKMGLAGTMSEIGGNYEIRGNEAIVNISGRVERLKLHDDYIVASLYDEGVDAIVNLTFRKVNSIGVSNSQWIYIFEYRKGINNMKEVVTLRFKNGGKFEEINELYVNGRLDILSTISINGDYSTYGNNVILHKRNENSVLVNIENELLLVQGSGNDIYIANFIRK